MFPDFILNGVGHGSVASRLLATGFNPAVLRPWLGADGRSYITVNQPQRDGTVKAVNVVTNTNATLRVREWIELDNTIMASARPQLRAVSDLRSRGLVKTIPNGFGKTVFQTQRVTHTGSATISMSGLRKGKNDRPEYDLANLPLPIIHGDVTLDAREVEVSRNVGPGIDTTQAAETARRVADLADQLLMGTSGSYSYGGGTVYGYLNWPSRQTYVMILPTGAGWTPQDTLADFLAIRQLLLNDFKRGPWMVYNSPAWDQFLDDDFSATKGQDSLRDRLMRVKGIQDIQTMDFLTGYRMVWVNLDDATVREVIGMDIQTLQWEEQGGMEIHMKIMCIMVPDLRADIEGNSGVVDCTAA
jgi:hypothetical protein